MFIPATFINHVQLFFFKLLCILLEIEYFKNRIIVVVGTKKNFIPKISLIYFAFLKTNELFMGVNTPLNNKKIWTASDISKLKTLTNHNTPIDQIAKKLNRSVWAVYNKARDIK